MSLLKIEGKEESVRINLTLPNSLYNRFEEIRLENDLQRLEAIRSAIKFWVEYETTKSMAEGYRETARENAQLMEDFKHVDEEIW